MTSSNLLVMGPSSSNLNISYPSSYPFKYLSSFKFPHVVRMGNTNCGFLDAPITEVKTECGECQSGIQWAISSMQGWRSDMEDAHCCHLSLDDINPSFQNWSFFGVFDGHAGKNAAKYTSAFIAETVFKSDELNLLAKALVDEDGNVISPEEERKYFLQSQELEGDFIATMSKAIHDGLLKFDELMRRQPELDKERDKSGTTAIAALLTPSHVIVANCGDSRAALYRTNELAFETRDHKPTNAEEFHRVTKAGGEIIGDRVNGYLAVSRALGDYFYKSQKHLPQCEQYVSPEPDIYVAAKQPDDQFLVLACDGAWDVISTIDMGAFVRSRMRLTSDMAKVSQHVISKAFRSDSKDNITALIIAFPAKPEVSEEAMKKELELEEKLAEKIKAYMEDDPEYALDQICIMLNRDKENKMFQEIDLQANYTFIEETYNKYKPETPQEECPTHQLNFGMKALLLLQAEEEALIGNDVDYIDSDYQDTADHINTKPILSPDEEEESSKEHIEDFIPGETSL